ncbi:MAG TPA: hypothetical protein VIZ65_00400 [Cellvibrionaceae bacterium]
MPGIKYQVGGGWQIIQPGSNRAEIRLIDGSWQSVDFLGFICQHALSVLVGGKYAKINVRATVSGDVYPTCIWKWHPLGSYGLGWRATVLSGKTEHVGVYAIVDDAGWPIIKIDTTIYPPRPPAKVFLMASSAKGAC